MDEFHALRAEGFGVGDEPTGEHRGKHGGGLWIAGFTAPDIQLLALIVSTSAMVRLSR